MDATTPPPEATTPAAPPRRATVAFFLLCLGTYAFFSHGGGPNSFSRFALTRALVERGTVVIDHEHDLTFDKAQKDGHFYCDKAPGLSLVAIPGYALARPLIERFAAPGSWANVNASLYAMTLLAVSLPVALAMTSFFRRAWREAGPATGLGISIALALGSPLTVWSSLFYSHALAAALIWLAFDWSGPTESVQSLSLRRAFLAGLCAGLATLSEFPVALLTLLLGLRLLTLPTGRATALVGYVLGGLPSVVLLIGYNLAAFGEPLASGYRYHFVPEFREAMSAGVMGITGPTWDAVLGCLVGRERGLFLFWPFFLLVPLGVVIGLMRRSLAPAGTMALLFVLVYGLFGCSYYLWTGGASYGPRHLVPALPFAAYLVVRAAGPLRRAVPIMTAVSVAVTLVASATLVEFPDFHADSPPETHDPLLRMALPRFLSGNFSAKVVVPEQEGRFGWSDEPLPPEHPSYYDACNLGEWLGLRGHASLAPLALLALGCGLVLRGSVRGGRFTVHDVTTVSVNRPVVSGNA